MKKKIHIIIILIISVFSICTTVFSQSSDNTLKAVALEKLSLFITWPNNVLPNNSSDVFIVAVLKNKAFGMNLEKIYKTHPIKNRKVQVVYINKIEELKNCHLLYISNTNAKELKKILAGVKNKPILLVSDKKGFAIAGSHINMYYSNDKLRFEINQMALEQAGFKIDYQLLHVSKIINPTTK